MRRREFLASSPVTILAAASIAAPKPQQKEPPKRTGRIKHGVTRQVFGSGWSLEDGCQEAARQGVQGFDFVDNPSDWPLVKKYGLTLSMYRLDFGGGLSGGRAPEGPPGWNAIGLKQAQGDFLKQYHNGIDFASANGIPNMILLAGSRSASLSYEQGAENAVEFCNQVKAHAEDKGVTLCMEFLNSKGIQAPLMSLFDHMAWGVDVVTRVNSPNVKILYDIFHAQLSEGYIVQTIRDNIQHIGHFHTGGVPGRHELDETQELNFRFIAQAIADSNFTGFVTHEWTPAPGNDPVASLAKVIQIMDV